MMKMTTTLKRIGRLALATGLVALGVGCGSKGVTGPVIDDGDRITVITTDVKQNPVNSAREGERHF